LRHTYEYQSLSQSTAFEEIHGLVEVRLMALNFPILLYMALYALIPPLLDSLPSKKSFAQFGLISFMVSSHTALYSIVLINTGISLSSAFKDVFGLVGV